MMQAVWNKTLEAIFYVFAPALRRLTTWSNIMVKNWTVMCLACSHYTVKYLQKTKNEFLKMLANIKSYLHQESPKLLLLLMEWEWLLTPGKIYNLFMTKNTRFLQWSWKILVNLLRNSELVDQEEQDQAIALGFTPNRVSGKESWIKHLKFKILHFRLLF